MEDILQQIEFDILSGLTLAIILGMTTYLVNFWQKRKKEIKRQNIVDNRYKEAILTLAEAFDNEIQRLHPDKNVPPIVPKIVRLVTNGDHEF